MTVSFVEAHRSLLGGNFAQQQKYVYKNHHMDMVVR